MHTVIITSALHIDTDELTINSKDAEKIDELSQNQDSIFVFPIQILDDTNSSDVRIAFTVYDKTTLFPVRVVSRPNITRSVVSSQIVSAIVGGVVRGTTLTDPVRFYLRLTNAPFIQEDEMILNRLCAFWDFTAASE